MCHYHRLMTPTQRKHRFELDRQRRETDVFLAIVQAYGASTSASGQKHVAAALESMTSLLEGARKSRIKEVKTEKLIARLLENEASQPIPLTGDQRPRA